jgi:hypothetical protein
MPQSPIIIPVIITGILVGSLIKSKAGAIPKKKIAYASLASGLLNALYAYGLYLMTPRSTLTRAATVQESPELVSAFSSFIAGFLIVLAIVGVAMIYIRLRGGGAVQDTEDTEVSSKPELESKPP